MLQSQTLSQRCKGWECGHQLGYGAIKRHKFKEWTKLRVKAEQTMVKIFRTAQQSKLQ